VSHLWRVTQIHTVILLQQFIGIRATLFVRFGDGNPSSSLGTLAARRLTEQEFHEFRTSAKLSYAGSEVGTCKQRPNVAYTADSMSS
jgi:hypothetical protein